jgi:hypothetical protein
MSATLCDLHRECTLRHRTSPTVVITYAIAVTPALKWAFVLIALDVYQPTGWNSPGAKRVAHIYWRVMITIVKMLLAIPLTLMLLGSVWLLWFLVTLL